MTATSETLQRMRGLTGRRGAANASLIIGAGILIVLLVFSLLIGVVSVYGVNTSSSDVLAGPSASHWFGTDNLGRDLLTRVAYATRGSLLISAASTALAALIGSLLGLAAGYLRGRMDNLIMGGVDLLLSVPPLLLALTVVAIAQSSVETLILGIGIIFLPYFARIVRSSALQIRERAYVQAARVSGVPSWRIAVQHILPNSLSPVLVQFGNTAAIVILLEASLSYLGLGIQPPQPSWGRMVFDGQHYMQLAPLTILVPGVFIILASTAWGLLSDGVRKLFDTEAERKT